MTAAKTFGGESGTVLDSIPQPSCAAFLGYEFLSVDHEARSMRVRFQGTDKMLNPRGGVQGGFLTAMLDDAMGSMIVVLTKGRKGPASVDIHTQYLRPAAPGPLTCDAEVVHRRRRRQVAHRRDVELEQIRRRIADEESHRHQVADQVAVDRRGVRTD